MSHPEMLFHGDANHEDGECETTEKTDSRQSAGRFMNRKPPPPAPHEHGSGYAREHQQESCRHESCMGIKKDDGIHRFMWPVF